MKAGFWSVVAILIAIVPAAMWNSFVLMKLWGWFVTPLGIPVVEWSQAYGLMLIVGIFKGYDDKKSKYATVTDVVSVLISWAFVPAFILLIGSIVHSL